MKGLFVRLPAALDHTLTARCRQDGRTKVGVITELVEEYLVHQPPAEDPLDAAQAYGIDLSLLTSNLRKSPTERLRDHAAGQAFVTKLRKAGKKRDQL